MPPAVSKDDIRRAEVELHNLGLYNGSLDGTAGPETRRVRNGPERTATLDQRIAALIGSSGVGQGSNQPGAGAASMRNFSAASDLGSLDGQK
jgi:hypothetical protein